ncbi:MAG: PKD domain-containing protein [Bacteroidia bacterium]
MKTLLLSLLLTLTVYVADAQQFVAMPVNGSIPDNNTMVYFPLSVSGLPNQINSSFGLTYVSININHQYDANLKIYIISPDSTVCQLTSNNGFGPYFVGTCFTMSATLGIQGGSPPFIGNFLPVQSINMFNTNKNPNGTWQLAVIDEVPLDTGYVESFILNFGNNPPPDPVLTGVCSTADASGCYCPNSFSLNCDLLPDMTSAAEEIISDHVIYTDYLNLGNATPNIGYGPLEIHGINSCFCDTVPVSCTTTLCPGGQTPKQLVNQRVYHKSFNQMTYYDRPAGTMQYHPTHGHIHLDAWASYTLRMATTNPDARTWPVVGSGNKTSFCLINLGDCDNNYGFCHDTSGNVLTSSDIPNYGLGSVTGCGTDQGIFVGNLDIYSSGLDGQTIYFPGICDDNYYIVSITDPDNYILEMDENNNWVAVPVNITTQPGVAANKQVTVTASGAQFTFTSAAPASYTFHWDFGDSTTATGQTAIHAYANPGNYQVVLTIDNGTCITYTYTMVNATLTTGVITSQSFLSDVSVSPNPFTKDLKISFHTLQSSNVKTELLDIMGKTVLTLSNTTFTPGQHNFVVKENLNTGVYFIRISTNDKVEVKRVVKL